MATLPLLSALVGGDPVPKIYLKALRLTETTDLQAVNGEYLVLHRF